MKTTSSVKVLKKYLTAALICLVCVLQAAPCLIIAGCSKNYDDTKAAATSKKKAAAPTTAPTTAPTIIQAAFRGHNARKHAETERRAEAATTIPALARGYKVRKQAARERAEAEARKSVEAATTIQKVGRRQEAETALAARDRALAAAQAIATEARAAGAAAAARAQEAETALAARDRALAAAQAQFQEQLVEEERLRRQATSEMTFGKEQWARYIGNVGEEPPLPTHIDTILDSPCPFWPGKKVRHTHLLVLIPATVDGAPFTLNSLGTLIQNPKGEGRKTKYGYYGEVTKRQLGDQSPSRSYWVLMTRDVLPDSRDQANSSQKGLVAGHAERTGLPYEMPHALEAATAILMHYVRTEERLFGDSPYTYTWCQDKVDNSPPFDCPVTVGGFSSGGLLVYYFSNVLFNFGVSCLRKF